MFYNAETELTNLSTGRLYTQIHPTGIFNCVRQLAHRLIQLMSANRLYESLQKVCLRPLVDWMKSGFGQHSPTSWKLRHKVCMSARVVKSGHLCLAFK